MCLAVWKLAPPRPGRRSRSPSPCQIWSFMVKRCGLKYGAWPKSFRASEHRHLNWDGGPHPRENSSPDVLLRRIQSFYVRWRTYMQIRRKNRSISFRHSRSLKVIGTHTGRSSTYQCPLAIRCSFSLFSVSETSCDFGRKLQFSNPPPPGVYSTIPLCGLHCNFVTAFRHRRLDRNGKTWKRRSERRKHCALAVVIKDGAKIFRPATDSLPGSSGPPKFNQLEMVTTFTYKPSLVRIDARNF